MRRFLLKRCRYDNKEGRESCIDFGAGPQRSSHDQDQLGYRPCTLTRRPAPKSTATLFMSLSSFSGNRAARFSKKIAAQASCPPAWTDSSGGEPVGNRASRLVDRFSAGNMPAGPKPTEDVGASP